MRVPPPPPPGGVVVVAMNHRILLGVKDKMTVTRGLGKNSEKGIYLTADWKKGTTGKVLFSSFHLNDHTLGFYPQTQKVEPPCTA